MMYIECYADEKLIRALGVSRRNYDHIGDIGGVSRLLQKHGNSLGMIDEDPGKTYPTYFKKLPVKDSKHGLKTLYDEELNNLIVVICPRLEEWIIQILTQNKLNLKRDFKIPAHTGHELHKVIMSHLPKFELLVKELLNRQAEPLLYLQKLLLQ